MYVLEKWSSCDLGSIPRLSLQLCSPLSYKDVLYLFEKASNLDIFLVFFASGFKNCIVYVVSFEKHCSKPRQGLSASFQSLPAGSQLRSENILAETFLINPLSLSLDAGGGSTGNPRIVRIFWQTESAQFEKPQYSGTK